MKDADGESETNPIYKQKRVLTPLPFAGTYLLTYLEAKQNRKS